jgi:predicted ATPase/class 3 adenylate cyclase
VTARGVTIGSMGIADLRDGTPRSALPESDTLRGMAVAGTVTLVFTDLVGSTELLVALGEERFGHVRDEHDRLVMAAVECHRGRVVKHTGDGVMAAFAGAADAVSAAIEMQERIAARNAASEITLGVRIGISAGDVSTRGGDYYGVPVIEAARLCAASLGGQILASDGVRMLVGSWRTHEFVPLGDLDLKGLPALAAVAVRWSPTAPVGGPPARRVGNLPMALGRFVGRTADIAAARELVGLERLVTLVGAGGSGKTRLALEVAHHLADDYAGGGWFVELAPIADERLIAEATLTALGLQGPAGTAESAIDRLQAHLTRRPVLLVVDNCEHLVDGAARVIAQLLERCPSLHVLATSRESLRVAGEFEYPVAPLDLAEAVELLTDRTRAVRPDLTPDAYTEVFARICAAVDGLPLAIELAAARLRVLSPESVADLLDDQLRVLTHGTRARDKRQRTLRATLDWSHDLLDEDEQAVFRRLAVFAGGFRLEAAAEVIADDEIGPDRVVELVENLAERSLVRTVPSKNGSRLNMLEPIRQYAAEKLRQAGEQDWVTATHVRWVTGLARQAWQEFFVAQRTSTERLAEEHANICCALDCALQIHDHIDAARIVEAVGYAWYTVGQPDGRLWCERVLAAVPADLPAMPRAGVLVATAISSQDGLDFERSTALLTEARVLYRSVGSAVGEAWALTWLGRVAYINHPAGADTRAYFEEALELYQTTGVQAGVGWCTSFLAQAALHDGDIGRARAHAEEAERLGRSTGIGQVAAEGLRLLAMLDDLAGDLERADQRIAEVLDIHAAAGDRWQLAATHAGAAEIAAQRHDVGGAASHVLAAAELATEMRSPERVLDTVGAAAFVLHEAGHDHDAAVLLGALRGHRYWKLSQRLRLLAQTLEQEGFDAELAEGRTLEPFEALERATGSVVAVLGFN